MSREQWGHGFHAGVDAGQDAGYARGLEVPAMLEAEQMDVLFDLMATLLNEPVGPRHWALLRTMSEVNAKNMLSPERAWHRRQASDQHEPAKETASDGR